MNVVGYVQRLREYILTWLERVRNWGSKGMNGCPLTSPPLQRCGVMSCEDLHEVTRSAWVKGMVLKMATLMWQAAPGFCDGILKPPLMHETGGVHASCCDHRCIPSTWPGIWGGCTSFDYLGSLRLRIPLHHQWVSEVEEEHIGGLKFGLVWQWTISPLGRQDVVVKVVVVAWDDGRLVTMSLPWSHTLSPGAKTGAGLHWQL
jgi:hypothetical protein